MRLKETRLTPRHSGHYQGGIGKQVVHTIVDGGMDRLVDMGEERFDNPLIDAALIGAGHKIKNELHERINGFGAQAEATPNSLIGKNIDSNRVSSNRAPRAFILILRDATQRPNHVRSAMSQQVR